MHSAYKLEDSGKETLSIEIVNLYINRKSVIQNYNFRNAKMYGTLFSYIGSMAHAVYKNGCCVPEFIFDTLHNPNEQNPRKRLAKLTMKNAIAELGVLKDDEGCCIEQVANLLQNK